MIAADVERSVDHDRATTIAVAGIACRLVSRYPKPILWATELHPEFVVGDARPEVTLALDYDVGYWERGLPWIAEDTVSDDVEVSENAGVLHVTSAYYHARLTRATATVDVEMASGFRVDGLMRTLYTLLGLERGVLFVDAEYREEGDDARLVLDPGARRHDQHAIVALARAGRDMVVHPTPFHAPDLASSPRAPRILDALRFVAPGPGSAAHALARFTSHVCVADRRPAAIARVLEAAAHVLSAVPAIEDGDR